MLCFRYIISAIAFLPATILASEVDSDASGLSQRGIPLESRLERYSMKRRHHHLAQRSVSNRQAALATEFANLEKVIHERELSINATIKALQISSFQTSINADLAAMKTAMDSTIAVLQKDANTMDLSGKPSSANDAAGVENFHIMLDGLYRTVSNVLLLGYYIPSARDTFNKTVDATVGCLNNGLVTQIKALAPDSGHFINTAMARLAEDIGYTF